MNNRYLIQKTYESPEVEIMETQVQTMICQSVHSNNLNGWDYYDDNDL